MQPSACPSIASWRSVFDPGAATRARRCAVALLLLLGVAATPAVAQERVADGTTIARVEIAGLKTISEGFVRRSIKTRAGQPFLIGQTQEDVRELLRTRKFLNVVADPRLEAGEVVVTFTLQEKPEVATVEIEGAKRFTSEQLYQELSFAAGQPLDRFEVNRGLENILRKYREKGYYYAEVELDEAALDTESRVIYRIVEGPRVKVRRIEFEGVSAFSEVQLLLQVKTQTYFWILRTGAFDEEMADRDALDLQAFYRNEGFLDARVGYRLDFSSVDRTDLNVVFVIVEGARYRVSELRIRGNQAIDEARLREVLLLKVGGIARDEAVREDAKRLTDVYGEIGYVDTRVDTTYDFVEEPGVAIVNFNVAEGARSQFGRITVRGNTRTKDEVVRRELKFYPGEDYNTVKARKAEQRLIEGGLFSRATITPLEHVEGAREALVDVTEADTANFIIGFGVSTDSGVLGQLTIQNRNFDLFDWPRTWGQFFRGRAFRGDGQRIRLSLEPGTEVSRFRIDFTEPYLLDLPLRYDQSIYLYQRRREAYDEQRLGFVPSLSRRFESGWLKGYALEGALRLEGVSIENVDALAARDIRDVAGDSFLSSIKGSIVRDTTDSRLTPSEGYRLSFSWEQAGVLGGDYDFGRPSASAVWYKTFSTDIYNRKSVLAVRGDVGWIVGDAPMFERFYGGGFGSIRGLAYRGVGPTAGIFKNRVGGNFVLLTGAEYTFPLYAETLRGATFLDMGTVEEDFKITSWRATVGFGVRINVAQVPIFGAVPIVMDFGFPIASSDQDDTQIFNFTVGLSF